VTPGDLTSIYPYYTDAFLNATAVRNVIEHNSTDTFYWSPRKVFPGINYHRADDLLSQYGNLFLIDTEAERAMHLGRDYGYSALG